MRKRVDGLQDTLRQNLSKRVIEHRNHFVFMFSSRYAELLPFLINYKNIGETSIDSIKLEHNLRIGKRVVVGENADGIIQILGYVNAKKYNDRYLDLETNEPLTHEDITFTIPKCNRKSEMKEILIDDDCKSGDFIVLSNKYINFTSDYDIIEYYTVELGEIVLSRFSLVMQSKINTFFIGQNNDESVNEVANALYNGSPFIVVNKYFDVKESIYTINNSNITQALTELKREYQNKIGELNNMLGINSLAVDKESGVSDLEAKSNSSYTTSNANIYIDTRQNEFDKLNKRYGLNIITQYNDNVKSELENKINELGDDDNANKHNSIQYSS